MSVSSVLAAVLLFQLGMDHIQHPESVFGCQAATLHVLLKHRQPRLEVARCELSPIDHENLTWVRRAEPWPHSLPAGAGGCGHRCARPTTAACAGLTGGGTRVRPRPPPPAWGKDRGPQPP